MGSAVPATFDTTATSAKAIQQQESWDELVEKTLRKEQEHKERRIRKQQLLLEKMRQGDLSILTSLKHKSNRESSSYTASTTGRSSRSLDSKATSKSDNVTASRSKNSEQDIIVSSKPVLEKPKMTSLSMSQSSSRTNGSRLKVSCSADQINDEDDEEL